MKALRVILALITALCGAALPLWLMRHGINYQDEPYQMLNAAEYLHSPLAPLTAWSGHLWSSWFGFNLLAFRTFAVICMLLSVAIPAGYMYRCTRRADVSLAAFGIASLWLAMMPAKGYLYSWDCLSWLFIVAIMVLCVSYLRQPGAGKAVWIGVGVALAALARVPNAVCLAVALPVVAVYAPKGRKIRYSLLSAGAFAFVAIICIFGIYGSPVAYIESLRENIITGHGLRYLLEGYERSYRGLLQFSAFAGAILLATRMAPGVGSMAVLCVTLIPGCTLPTFPLATTSMFMSIGLLVAALVLSRVGWRVGIIVGALAFCATVGSDLGFEKIITLQAVILLGALCHPRRRKAGMLGAAVMLVLVMMTEIPAQKERGFEDAGFGHTSALVTSTPFAGVFTTPERAAEISRLDSVITDWHTRGGEVLVLGDCFHYAVDLISGEPRPASLRHVYLIDYQNYYSKVQKLIETRTPDSPPLLIITSRPLDWRYPDVSTAARLPILTDLPTLPPTPSFDLFFYP